MNQGNKKTYRRVLASLLSVAVALGGMTIPAAAESAPIRTSSNTITGFEELPEDVTSQTVALGTSQEELDLPETLTATVTTGSAITVVPDSGDSTGAEEQPEEETDVTEPEETLSEATPSDSEPADEPEEEAVEESEAEPIEAVEDTVSENISVTWTSDPAYEPETEDTYIFIPALPEGYALADGVSLPEIAVTVMDAMGIVRTSMIVSPLASSGAAIDVGDSSTIDGTGWTYADGVFTVTDDVTITGTTTTNRVVVQSGVTANITLDNVNINTNTGAALDMQDATVNLELNGTNIVSTTVKGSAGIQTTGGTLTIDGTGSLTASGGDNAAGIGGGSGSAGGSFTINSGIVVANSGKNAAGIGGGNNGGGGGDITINGGTVTARGNGSYGAGIGGGERGGGGVIAINGGTVTATGTSLGAGIGGGREGSGGTITISGGTVAASSDTNGAGIGGGYSGSGGTITISGGTVTAAGGSLGAGIGNGNKGSGGTLKITGGSVKRSGDATSEAMPTNGQGANIYFVTLTVGAAAVANTAITAGSIGGVACANTPNAINGVYGIKDVKADGGGKLYFWLPAITDAEISVTANGEVYSKNAVTVETDNTTAATLISTLDGTVTISGTAAYGETLTADTDGITSSAPGAFAYQWKRNDTTDIGTGSTRTLTTDDIGATITVTVTAANCNGTLTSGSVTVTKAAGSFGSPSAINTTYTPALTLADITPPANYVWTNSLTPITAAGGGQTFPATYTDPSGNYEPADGYITVNVAKATPSLTLEANPTSTQSRPGSVELTATLPADVTGTLTFKAGTSNIATITLPVNTATFTPTGADNAYSFTVEYSGNGNYENKTSTALTYSFTKSEQANVIASDGSVNYGETLDLSALVSGGSGTGALSFSKIDGPGEIDGTTLTPTGAGDVNITVTKAADHDYNAKSAAFKVTVNPRVITFTVAAVETQAHTGSPVTPTPEVRDGAAVLTAGAHFTYSYDNNTGAGASATINITGIGSYAGSTGSTTFTIGGIAPGITTPPSVSGTVYTGTALSQISLTGGVASVSGHFEWVNPSATIVPGSNTFEARFVPGDNLLYAEVPGINVTFNAVNRSSGGSSSDNDSSDLRNTTIVPAIKPNQPTAASVSATAQVTNGNAALTITDSMVRAAVEKALADAKAKGNTANGISVDISVTATGATGFALTLERTALNRLLEAGVKSFSVSSLPVNMSFNTAALKQIQAQSGGNLTITVKPATVTGLRNAFDITLNSTKDGKAVNITSLGTGTSTLSISAEPGKNEFAGCLYGAYVDTNNQITRIADSAYDANSRRMILSTDHFSFYGVGYTAPSAALTDIGSHWARESIDYVIGRGLFTGGADGKFNPDTAITRGDFVTALGRLSGADVSGYTTSSFTDVKADAYYLPYIEWAYRKGIIQGIGSSQFAPDSAITREEIAVILQNYAKAAVYTLPITREAATYADASSTGSAYKSAVTAMQQAGIMMGGTDNRFNPKSSATRAEASSMLHRYIKLTIDPATAQGWAKNDNGQYLYYKAGKALTGWWNVGENDSQKTYYFDKDGIMVSGKWIQTDGKWYYFYADGSLAKSVTVDGYEVDENGVRKED